MGMWDTLRASGRRSILDAIRDFRNAEAQGAKAVVERLEDRRLLSMTWASIATSDGTGQQVQGGSVTFNLACGTDDGGDSNVTVNFGDNTSVSLTLSPDSNGNYSGTVTHSYTGTPTTVYTAVMDASETSLVSGGGDSTSGGSTYSSSYVTTYADASCDVTIVDAPITATPTTTTVVAGRPFTGVVATVADSYTGAQAAEFSGQVIWGDGVTSAADFLAVPGSPGQFQVLGSHVYVSPTRRPPSPSISSTAPPPPPPCRRPSPPLSPTRRAFRL